MQASGSAREHLPQEFVDGFKRERAARAIGELVHEVGVNRLTVSLVTERAKMARATFYELFENRDDAVAYAVALGSGKLREAIDRAVDRDGTWAERAEAAIGAVLEVATEEPALSELCLVYHPTTRGTLAGPYGTELVDALAAVLRQGRPGADRPGPPPRTEELVSFGILGVIAERLRHDEVASLRSLAADLSDLAIRPFGLSDLQQPS